MSDTDPLIWVLSDDRPGNAAQCVGVADALGLPYIVKDIRYNFAAALPNVFLGNSLIGLHNIHSSPLEPPWPDLVIAAGRRAAPIAKWIKRKNPECFLVHLMWPDCAPDPFDLIALPEHDDIPLADTILTTTGAPHPLTHSRLAEESQRLKDSFEEISPPYVALLVGGNAKDSRYREADFHQLAELSSALAQQMGASLLVTTSPRTPARAVDVLRLAFTVPYHLHRFGDGDDNPYLAYLGLADTIVVTGDSMSMCSEACFTGKPTYIFSSGGSSSHKHQRFHKRLFELGLAKPLTGLHYEEWQPREPLNAAQEIAGEVKKRWQDKA